MFTHGNDSTAALAESLLNGMDLVLRKQNQHLTKDVGVLDLQHRLSKVMFLMKGCASWREFSQRLDIAAPSNPHRNPPLRY